MDVKLIVVMKTDKIYKKFSERIVVSRSSLTIALIMTRFFCLCLKISIR